MVNATMTWAAVQSEDADTWCVYQHDEPEDYLDGVIADGLLPEHARLIAHAPAMLDALRDCVASLERLPNTDGAYRQTCINQARAILRTVEG